MQQERTAAAEESLRKATELRPEYPEAYNALGALCDRPKRYRESESAFTRALELRPDHTSAHYNLGLSYLHQRRFSEALERLGRRLTETMVRGAYFDRLAVHQPLPSGSVDLLMPEKTHGRSRASCLRPRGPLELLGGPITQRRMQAAAVIVGLANAESSSRPDRRDPTDRIEIAGRFV